MIQKSILGIEFEYDDELTDPDKLAAFMAREVEARAGGMLDSHAGVVSYGEFIPIERGLTCTVEDTYDGDDREAKERAAPLEFEIVRDAYGVQVMAHDEHAGELGYVALELFHNELRAICWTTDETEGEPQVTTLRANVAAMQRKNGK